MCRAGRLKRHDHAHLSAPSIATSADAAEFEMRAVLQSAGEEMSDDGADEAVSVAVVMAALRALRACKRSGRRCVE